MLEEGALGAGGPEEGVVGGVFSGGIIGKINLCLNSRITNLIVTNFVIFYNMDLTLLFTQSDLSFFKELALSD